MEYDYGNWLLVIGLSVLFIYFAYDAFKPKTPIDWRSFGAFSAFIIALFAEMYGFPLTIYLLSSWFGSKLPQLNFSHNSGHLWEIFLGNSGDPHFSFFHIVSYTLIIFGLIIISLSWQVLYKAARKHTLATTGPYKFIRHPQYLGFIIIIIGFLLQWPTIPTLIMAPILTGMYLILAKKEEKEMTKRYPEYEAYKEKVPAFIPKIQMLLKTTELKLNKSFQK